jgi:hypothetical protein
MKQPYGPQPEDTASTSAWRLALLMGGFVLLTLGVFVQYVYWTNLPDGGADIPTQTEEELLIEELQAIQDQEHALLARLEEERRQFEQLRKELEHIERAGAADSEKHRIERDHAHQRISQAFLEAQQSMTEILKLKQETDRRLEAVRERLRALPPPQVEPKPSETN